MPFGGVGLIVLVVLWVHLSMKRIPGAREGNIFDSGAGERCDECGAKIGYLRNPNRVPNLRLHCLPADHADFVGLIICSKCASGDRPWRCRACRHVFTAKAPSVLHKTPECPACRAKASLPLALPQEVRGDLAKVAAWKRSTVPGQQPVDLARS